MSSLVVHEGDGFHEVEEFGGQDRCPFRRRRSANLKGEVAQPVRDRVILEVGVAAQEVWEASGDGEGSMGVSGKAAQPGVKSWNHPGILQ